MSAANAEIADRDRKIHALEQQLEWECVQRRRLTETNFCFVRTLKTAYDGVKQLIPTLISPHALSEDEEDGATATAAMSVTTGKNVPDRL